jgi:hypothetical protein
MKLLNATAAGLLLCLASESLATEPTNVLRHLGMCDASAAIALGANVMVVADDEASVLHVYDRKHSGFAAKKLNLTDFLAAGDKHPEVDLEGAAESGGLVYWISSHGTNRAGKMRPGRHRFFATRLKLIDGQVHASTVGKPYQGLLEDLCNAPSLVKYDFRDAAARPPKSLGALSIEGLAAAPNGSLLIGFRNPIPRGKALLVPLLNPSKVIDGTTHAEFGPPVEIELGGLGIRDIGYMPARKLYLIAAGPHDAGDGAIYTWDGTPTKPPKKVAALDKNHWRVEALVIGAADQDSVQVLSDDGTLRQNGQLADKSLGAFRSGWLGLGKSRAR